MGALSSLFATPTQTPEAVPISNGSGLLDDWVTQGSSGIPAGPIVASGLTMDSHFLLGRFSAGGGAIEEITVGGGLSMGSGILAATAQDLQTALNALSTTRGSIIFRGATQWQALAPGLSNGVALLSGGSGADPYWEVPPASIYTAWVAAVDAAGGTYATNSKAICSALADQLVAASYYSKIKWLVPLLGSNLAAARVPLIDTLSVGIMGNTGFVDADFTEATGIKGNGSSKILDTKIKPSQLGVSNSGGLGYWENQIDATGTSPGEPMACWGAGNTQGFAVDFRSSGRGVYWGSFSNGAFDAVSGTNGHYYCQRSSAVSREAFFGGASIATNTASDTASGAGDFNVGLLGVLKTGPIFYSKCRCACSYMTDGTLTAGEAAAFHTLLSTYLITPTGR